MKYIIDEEELRDLLRNYFMIDAINLGKTNKDDIFDDFEDYLNNNDISPESYKDFEDGFNVLINEEIDVIWKNYCIGEGKESLGAVNCSLIEEGSWEDLRNIDVMAMNP